MVVMRYPNRITVLPALSHEILFDLPLFLQVETWAFQILTYLLFLATLQYVRHCANVRLSVSSFVLARDGMFHLVHNSFTEFAGSPFTNLHIIVPVLKQLQGNAKNAVDNFVYQFCYKAAFALWRELALYKIA
jgi:hypothetical protein